MKAKNETEFFNNVLALENNKKKGEITIREKYEAQTTKLLECYDLYHEGKYAETIEKIEELKNSIFFAETNNFSDPFWPESAGSLFAGIAYEVIKNNKKEDVNFMNILFFKIDGKEVLEDLKEYLKDFGKDSYTYINLFKVADSPNETKGSIISVFRQQLRLYAVYDANK